MEIIIGGIIIHEMEYFLPMPVRCEESLNVVNEKN